MTSVSPSATALSSKLDHIEGLRALMALFVVGHHVWLSIWPMAKNAQPVGWHKTVTYWLAHGHYPVTAFIAISGFCLGIPLARKGRQGWVGGWEFIKRRAKRILPPYYASILVILVLAGTLLSQKTGTHWDSCIPIDYSQLWRHLLLVHDFTTFVQINNAYWSIAVEWHIYLLFPLLVWLWMRGGNLLVVTTCFVGGFWLHGVVTGTKAWGTTPHYLAVFSLGFFAAQIAFAEKYKTARESVQWGWLGGLILAAFAYAIRDESPRSLWPYVSKIDILIGVAACCLLIAGCRPGSYVRIGLSVRPLVAVGRFSYSLYLIHLPVIQLCWLAFVRPTNLDEFGRFSLLFLTSVPASLVVAYGFYLAFEKPFLRRT